MAGMVLDAGLRGRAGASYSSVGGGLTPVSSSTSTRPTAASTMGISATGSAASGSRKVAGPGAVGVGIAATLLLVFIYYSLPKG